MKAMAAMLAASWLGLTAMRTVWSLLAARLVGRGTLGLLWRAWSLRRWAVRCCWAAAAAATWLREGLVSSPGGTVCPLCGLGLVLLAALAVVGWRLRAALAGRS